MNFCINSIDMKASDIATINGGVPAVELMRRVGEAVYKEYEFWNDNIYIICGKGNNGGDGLALAQVLISHGFLPKVFLIDNNISADSKYFYDILQKSNRNIFYNIEQCDYNADIIVDCIFGTGFVGNPSEKYSKIINKINSSKSQIISIDIPSGLNADNGLFSVCVKANKTIAIQSFKLGHFLNDGSDVCGKVSCIDIGIVVIGEKINIIDSDYCAKYFPKRINNCNKSSFQPTAIMGGCTNYCGAVKLANSGLCSLRSGAGLCKIIIPKSIAFAYMLALTVDTTLATMDDVDGKFIFDKAQIDKVMKNIKVLAFGMGMGDNYDSNYKILEYILLNYSIDVIIDADGLNCLKNNMDILNITKCNVIITPHPKEMSRIINLPIEEILNNPINIAKQVAEKYNCVVLLKGTCSAISNGKETFILPCITPALAKGGSGDTLSGVIAGLLANKTDSFNSAVVASYLCAKSALIASKEYSEYGVLASDVSKCIKEIIEKNDI